MNTMIFCTQDIFDLIPDFSIADHFPEFKNQAVLFSVDNLKAFVTDIILEIPSKDHTSFPEVTKIWILLN